MLKYNFMKLEKSAAFILMLTKFCGHISFFSKEVFPIGALCGSSTYIHNYTYLIIIFTMNMYTLFPLCRKLFKAFIIILPLLGFTWVIGVFAVNEDTVAFATAFVILNSLQVIHGICMIHHIHQ